ncbi:dienelactone hydrolase [Scheffersomyces amazonensis]|uniref:dienelactone hydrolase n=1 Tax=Scheffersomyces amazonensis TaxID=1078765 RepID=UPI00315D08DD
MASNPPGACCIQGSFHEGDAKGDHKTIFGFDTYQTGEKNGNDRIIVIITDIYGHKFNNVLLIADELARQKYHVLIPDILNGDPVPATHGDLSEWLGKHGPEVTKPLVDSYLASVKKEYSPKFFGAIGYCFGAKYVIQNLAAGGPLDAGAAAHPSFVTIDEVSAIKKPIIISAAEVDPIFTVELRHESEKELTKIGARYQIDLFSGVSHGFAVRGDIKDPVVKYAKEKALADQVSFFSQY